MRIHQFSKTRVLALGVAAISAVLSIVAAPIDSVGAAPRSSSPAASWTLMGTVPGAAAQPTATGQRVSSLQAWQGRVYAGYGDWGANTGPITVSSIGAGESTFRADATLDTEAVETIRPVGDRLVIPATDPRNQTSDFAVAEPWTSGAALGATHIFDTATLTGTDLWMVGSKGSNAVAWRSLDGGTTWAEELVVPPADATSFARFYFAGVLGGKLYLQSVTASTGADATSRVFDGSTWTSGPALVRGSALGRKPLAVGSKLLYLENGVGDAGAVRSFNGSRSSTEFRSGVIDIAVTGDVAYALLADGSIKRSTSLGKWSNVAIAPTGASSLTVLDGHLYVGTTSATVWATASASN